MKIGTADLGEGHHPFAALADGAGDLVLDADGEARIVDEVEHRQVEEVAEVEMPLELVAAVGGQRAAVDVPAVRGDDAHRMAVHAHEAGDLVGAPQRPDLEEGVLVGQRRMARRTSKVAVRLRGTRVSSSSSRRSAGSADVVTGGAS